MQEQRIPSTIQSVEQLEDLLSTPSPGVIEAAKQVEGDVMLLGIGGKMGPTLGRQLKKAFEKCGKKNRVTGVSRFSDQELKQRLESWGIETLSCDLLDRAALEALPDAQHIIHLAAQKFGSTGNEERTWAMNVYLPGMVAERFHNANIVSLSTGNVYPLVPVHSGGSIETDPINPIGEYAQSCVGRERMFKFISKQNGTNVSMIRLNYAVELRYGILLDTAFKVWQETPIELGMGNVNVLWQGDANAYIIQSLIHTSSPPNIINITGPETVSIRWLANQFGDIFGKPPIFMGEEAPTALLNNAAKAFHLFGYPRVPLEAIIQWTAYWIQNDLPVLNKPTHFEQRDGKF